MEKIKVIDNKRYIIKNVKWSEVENFVCEAVCWNYSVEKDELSVRKKPNIAVLKSMALFYEEKLRSYKGHINCLSDYSFKSASKIILHIEKLFSESKGIDDHDCYLIYTDNFKRYNKMKKLGLNRSGIIVIMKMIKLNICREEYDFEMLYLPTINPPTEFLNSIDPPEEF